MFKATHYTWGSIFSCAITAIETALWDIMGKATGKPVYELLGGRVWDRVRLYSHIGGGSQIIRMNVDDGAIAILGRLWCHQGTSARSRIPRLHLRKNVPSWTLQDHREQQRQVG